MDGTDSNHPKRFPNEAVEVAVFRALTSAEGRHDALRFAWTCGANVDRIRIEIEEQEELVRSLQSGPMAPGASPRIYKDEYVRTLREIIAMVTKMIS